MARWPLCATGEGYEMVRARGEIEIDRPVEVVFDLVADERNRYDPRVRSAELLTDGPVEAGACFRVTSAGAGRPVEMIVEITGYEPPRRLASTTHLRFVDIHSTLAFEAVASRTRLRWSSEVELHGVLRLLGPLLGRVARRQSQRIWAALKHELEAGERQPMEVG